MTEEPDLISRGLVVINQNTSQMNSRLSYYNSSKPDQINL